MLSFRKCQEKDKVFVYSLTKKNMFDYFNKFLPEGWSDEKFWNGFDIERIIILESGENFAGFLDLESKADFLYVHNLQIDSQYAGNSFFLKKLVEEEAIKRKLNKIKGKVFIENKRALKYFQYCGYSIKEDKKLETESSIWVEKVLDKTFNNF